MDQSSYLSRTLWYYQEHGLYTDLTLVCEDGSLPTHAVMLAGLFTSFGISFLSREEVPECVFLPDLATATVQEAIKDRYLECDPNKLQKILKPKHIVKIEVEDHEVIETKCNVIDDMKEERDLKDNEFKQPFTDFNDDNCENYSDEEMESTLNTPKNKITESKSSSKAKEKKKKKFEHKTEASAENEASSVECPYCNKNYKTVRTLKSHLALLHREEVLLNNPEAFVKNESLSLECKCEHCGEVFPRKISLKKHMENVHGYKGLTKKRIKGEAYSTECPYCDKKLKTVDTLTSHLTILHREDVILNNPEIVMAIPCKECDEKFYEIFDLDKHSRAVHKKSVRQWTCRICPEIFDSNGGYVKHRKAKHLNKIVEMGLKYGMRQKDIKCPYCEKTITERFFNVHIVNNHKDNLHLHPDLTAKYDCAECDGKFYDLYSRRMHIDRNHTKGGRCDICSKVCDNNLALAQHKRTHMSANLNCNLCTKSFQTKARLKYHLQMHKGTRWDHYKYKCNECKKGRYQTEEGLQRHMFDNHSGQRYICSQCPSTFSNRDAVGIHKRVVHGEKLVKCNYCERAYACESYLKAHIEKVHEKTKNTICPHCGESFDLGQTETFKAHVNRHLNIKPFFCETCGKDFLTATHLKYHIRRHTLPYECNTCGARKSYSGDLADHMKQVHHKGEQEKCRFSCGFESWQSATRCVHEKRCSLNPIPGAPYTIAMGKATSYRMELYNASLKK